MRRSYAMPFIQLAASLCLSVLPCAATAAPVDLAGWAKQPADFAGAAVADGTATLHAQEWSFLLDANEYENVEVSAAVTVLEPAKNLDFFGSSWSAWPRRDWGDGGYEAGVLVRATVGDEASGYRVQLSHAYQDVALVKYPDGGYLRVAPCKVELNRPLAVVVAASGGEVVVSVDGREKIRYRDTLLPLTKGRVGVGVGGKVTFENVTVKEPPAGGGKAGEAGPHAPQFSARKWLGGRTWVFDGDEPVLELHSEQDPSCFAKLRPGYKPQITFDSHWGIENQGAFPEGASKWTAPAVEGGGKTIAATWSGRNVKGRFVTRSKLTVGYDESRGVYAYDVESELEVTAGEPFHFRYGYDFEHHTPLDPFRWQYFVVKSDDGTLYHRPVTPVDPGGMENLYARGVRMWYGRHVDQMHFAPAVEYDIADTGGRKLNTAVCAAFYDTGIAFGQEEAKPGSKVKVKYRYTAYPAAEAERQFKESRIYPSRMLDPEHHYLFADEWPRITFGQFEPMSKTWIYGRRPFMTAHNARPTYELAKDTGVGSGFAMKLGPDSYGKADLAVPQPLAEGRYVVTALVRSDNAHGPGGRIEVTATEAKTNKVLQDVKHYLGNGSFDCKKAGFVFEIPGEAAGLALGLGNAGTGDVLVTDVEFRKLGDGAPLPEGVSARANATPPKSDPAPAGAIADYRMEEQKGRHVLDGAGGPLGMLELANLDWAVDEGRPALRFADNTTGRRDYPRGRGIDVNYMGHPGYAGKQTVATAIAGQHGGGFELKAFTVAAWVKPAAAMGKSEHAGKGDVVGLGARRFILRLVGDSAPYRLAGCLNVNDHFEAADAPIQAGRWYHVAMTGEPTAGGKWRVRLYVDGKQVHEGVSQNMAAPASIPPSLILGAELFYLHDSYYRGLIGRTTVFERALSAEELAQAAGGGTP